MNNTQFRRLVLDTPTASHSSSNGAISTSTNASGPQATPSALGSRMRSSIDFARQLAERDASLNPTATKKFRSSAAPKGSKLGSGYQDRTQSRTSAEEDDKASRVKALEEMVKLGQMERTIFEALRDEIVGGDVKDVHLVKGLDWKLLERVRGGEDVLAESPKEAPVAASVADVDEELDKLEEREVQPATKAEAVKKGEMAPPPRPQAAAAGKKRTRDDILKELKASRQAAAEKARQPALGPKFHRFGEKKIATSRIERDEKGREILITVDADGNIKRKVKKAKFQELLDNKSSLLVPDKDIKPLGTDVSIPDLPAAAVKEEDDGDIFAGIGGDYDPLAGELQDEEGDTSDSDHDPEQPMIEANKSPHLTPITTTVAPTSPPPLANPTATSTAKKNYFNEDPLPSTSTSSTLPTDTFQDPTILAALKKASTLTNLPTTSTDEETLLLARRKRLLETHDRDAEDMDLGFGSSRFEDAGEDEEGGKKVKLSVWGKEQGGEEKGGDGKGKRKRGPKKKGKGGDKDSAGDVMRVLERRKAGGEGM
ncbi:MAG: hypothetical protein Q9220_007475 [cf. Caloplaca sp. 1 TL-2023]